jgi:phospholipase/carboxylesterase
MPQKLDGPFIPPKSGKAQHLVMFLHGYGASGNDLISIGEEWSAAMPDTAFVAPHAPEICEIYAGGYQWFSIQDINLGAFERDKRAEKVRPVLDAYIDEALARWQVPESQLGVVGFSQGAMMAMYAMPRRKTACAGVVGYSGILLEAEELKGPGIVKPPVLAIHGKEDDVVPSRYLPLVQSGFEAAGFNVETIMRDGLAHGIDQFGLMRGLQFLNECFEKQAEAA